MNDFDWIKNEPANPFFDNHPLIILYFDEPIYDDNYLHILISLIQKAKLKISDVLDFKNKIKKYSQSNNGGYLRVYKDFFGNMRIGYGTIDIFKGNKWFLVNPKLDGRPYKEYFWSKLKDSIIS